ncbi:MAG: energy-coupling factor transporter transmembrane protein EcfT [Treponema sp.]|jgi:energy-coupling factor transport system permease protein|nr:energy-coupling factor transporter transmembrane protein EcfT [Treponema sp.]
MTGLLDYIGGNSLLHRLNPLTKLILAFVLCASGFLTMNHLMPALVIVFTLCLSALSGTFRRSSRIFLSLLKFSLILFTVQVLFIREGVILLRLPGGFYITGPGLSFSLLFVLRLIAAAGPLALMLSVTKTSDIAGVLVRYLRIPYKYVFVLTTAMRFIPLFAEEMAGIMEAQTARGVDFDTKNVFRKIRLILPLCAPLLISSVRKIEGGAISAELRGFKLRTRLSGSRRCPFRPADAAVLVFCGGILAAAVIMG